MELIRQTDSIIAAPYIVHLAFTHVCSVFFTIIFFIITRMDSPSRQNFTALMSAAYREKETNGGEEEYKDCKIINAGK